MAKFAVCLALVLGSSAQAYTPAAPKGPNDLPGCIMANTNAINDMVDSALYIYASTKACTKTETTNACVADIASVVNSVVGVGEFVVKVFKTCGEIATSNYDCGIAGTALTGNLAAVTSASAWAAGDCKKTDSMAPGKGGAYDYADMDVCTVNVGAAMAGLQGAITSMMTVQAKCDTGNGGKCFSGVLDIIAAVGNLAVFLENVVTDCSQDDMYVINACSTDIAAILSGLAATASTSITIKEKCTPASTRLYQESDAPAIATNNGANLMTGMLVIFLPITGLASYYGGSRLKGPQTRRLAVASREVQE
jgi:hypothetical protein